MASRNVGKQPERGRGEGAKIMSKPLPQILDEMDANIRAAAEAARKAEEAARAAKQAAGDATKASSVAEKRAEDARQAGQVAAETATRAAADAATKAEETAYAARTAAEEAARKAEEEAEQAPSFGVLAATFRDESAATDSLQQLIDAGYDGSLISGSRNGAVFYEVHLGPYPSVESAQQVAAVLRESFGLAPTVVVETESE